MTTIRQRTEPFIVEVKAVIEFLEQNAGLLVVVTTPGPFENLRGTVVGYCVAKSYPYAIVKLESTAKVGWGIVDENSDKFFENHTHAPGNRYCYVNFTNLKFYTMATRKIWEIARDIRKNWNKPSPEAAVYIKAMSSLNTIDEVYITEPAREIVQRFLANAGKFQGIIAKQLKQELKELLEQ